jgi:transposase-like protein
VTTQPVKARKVPDGSDPSRRELEVVIEGLEFIHSIFPSNCSAKESIGERRVL